MSTRVLLVDDHSMMRAGVRSMLDAVADFTVIAEAADGIAAVAAAVELLPDMVVMDATLPGLNGVEATRRIKAELPSVRVLCLSLHSDQHLVASMLEAGASGFVVKDAAETELLHALRLVAANRTYLSPVVSDGVVSDYKSRLAAVSGERGPALTGRQRRVLQLIAEGHSTTDIAQHLEISAKTVASHREHIMKKLDLHNVSALTKYAIRHLITTSEPDANQSIRPAS